MDPHQLLEPGQQLLVVSETTLALELAGAVLPGKAHAIFQTKRTLEEVRRLAEGMELVNLRLHLADPTSLPFSNGTFDVVLIDGPEPDDRAGSARMEAEWRRVLRKGGRLLLGRRQWELSPE